MNFDAIMLCSYGGPRGMEDVLPFMRNATRGRGVPDERLLAVSGHYRIFDGISPINARNEELQAALAERLSVPVVIGNRNWTPYFSDTLKELDARGLHRVLCIFTAAFASYSGCRQYREDIAAALKKINAEDRFTLFRIPPYYAATGFHKANVAAARECLAKDAAAHLILVTHSIPLAMEEHSGSPTSPASSNNTNSDAQNAVYKNTYAQQHREVGKLICQELSEIFGREIPLDLAFCSRSGSPRQKWLEPDINDRLRTLSAAGVNSVVVLPFGFINDHMEVVYDLDTEAAQTAAELGMRYQRAATAGTNPDFIDSIVELINGQIHSAWPEQCPTGCCLPYANYAPLPAVFTAPTTQGTTDKAHIASASDITQPQSAK